MESGKCVSPPAPTATRNLFLCALNGGPVMFTWLWRHLYPVLPDQHQASLTWVNDSTDPPTHSRVHLPAYPPIYPDTYLPSYYASTQPPVIHHLPIRPSLPTHSLTHPPTCPPTHPPVHPSTGPPTRPLSAHLSHNYYPGLVCFCFLFWWLDIS